MDFCTSNSTILELDLGQDLSLSPAPALVPLFQMIETTDGAAHYNRLNVLDVRNHSKTKGKHPEKGSSGDFRIKRGRLETGSLLARNLLWMGGSA